MAIIKRNLPEKSVRDWFDPIVPLSLKGGTLTLQLPSQLHYEWIEERYIDVLRKAVHFSLGRRACIRYSILVDGSTRTRGAGTPIARGLPTTQTTAATTTKTPQGDAMAAFANNLSLRAHYLFENFVQGSCNQLACVAAQDLVKSKGANAFNPLVIYGKVGLGKTHLAQAIVNEFSRENPPTKKAVYIPSERFVTQFVDAVRTKRLNDFLDFHFDLDLLVVDDVQFLQGKIKTQEVFFHIFNYLHQKGKKLVFTSDVPPKLLAQMDSRLLSRFKWGLSAALEPPDYDTKLRIIHHRAKQDGTQLPAEVAVYLAHHVGTNVRELEGIIVSLVARSVLMKRQIDVKTAEEVVSHIIAESRNTLNEAAIISIVSEYFHVDVEAMKSSKRTREVVSARQVAMYFIKRHMKNCSLKHIGKKFFGGRDHSTVIHALKSVENLLSIDKKFRKDIEAIEQKMEALA